jgi:DNA-binding MarR family transcriptional regulator
MRPAPSPPAAPRRQPRTRSAARRGAGGAPAARPEAAEALDALRRIVRELRVAAAGGEAETGLSAAQLFVLQQVAAAPGLSLTEIAARTLTDRTSVAAVVDRLLARALVERRPGADDRRRAEIFATRAGARLLARAPHPPTRRVLDGMEAMRDRELRQLARGLGALARSMGLAGQPATMLFDDAPAPPRRPPTGAA